MDAVSENLAAVRRRISAAATRAGRKPDTVRLVLVTKTIAPERIAIALQDGQRNLGENKVQEGLKKSEALADKDIRWSMIGHLQTNKVKDVLRFAAEVQSLDRLSLAVALEKRLQQIGRSLDVFVQVNTSAEPSKYGLTPEEVLPFLDELRAFSALKPKGFMTLATFTQEQNEVRRCFRLLREIRDRAREEAPQGSTLFELSMGMSGDYERAIEEGATIVRVGQAVFGPRALPDEHYWPQSRNAGI